MLSETGLLKGLGHAGLSKGANWMPAGQQAADEKETYFASDLPIQRHYVPEVIMIMAPRGRGKSALTVGLAKYMLNGYRAKKLPVNIIANFWVSFAQQNRYAPVMLRMLSQFPVWARNKLFLWDEVTEFMPSGMAMSRFSRDQATVLRQLRKRGMDVIANTQFPVELDRRLLRQVTLFVEADIRHRKEYDRKRRCYKADVQMYIYDYWGNFNRDWRNKPWPPMRAEADAVMWMENIHTVFHDFNTNEIQVGEHVEGREDILEGEGWTLPETHHEVDEVEEEYLGPETPKTLTAYLDSILRPDGSINVADAFDGAKWYKQEWSSRAPFIAWLNAAGWRVDSMGTGVRSMTAWKK